MLSILPRALLHRLLRSFEKWRRRSLVRMKATESATTNLNGTPLFILYGGDWIQRFLPAATTGSSDSALQRFSGSRKTADAPPSSDYRAGAISSCGREKTEVWEGFRTHLDETLPEWRDKFLCYKPLKKLIKNLSVDGDEAADGHPWIGFEEWFVRMLDEELEKFNDFYVDKEFVIRLQLKALQEDALHAFSEGFIDWPLEDARKSPQQSNDYDCGVFVIKYMDVVTSLEVVTWQDHQRWQADMLRFRAEIAAQICKTFARHIADKMVVC
ncbi:SPX domain-containing protein 4 [Platanthera guangdongensis]|uniref:SPX domain-containing protein 4 n=1 Tax=Platanthera guangdongensis TaxID=2320717 RepID=A0ABR2LJV4_9ASPA